MRVTQSILNNQFLRNLRANNERMQEYQEMLASGKRINKPSDDPVGVSYVMRYKAQLQRNSQYMRNLDSAKSFLDTTDSTISKINDVLQRVRELTVQGASDTVPADAKNAIAKEVRQLKDELVNLGNTQFNGRYIFNGQKTDVAPYPETATSTVDTGDIVLAVSDGASMRINVNGNEIFGSFSGDNVFKVMDDLITSLESNDSAGVGNVLGRLDTRINELHNAWADVGARSNRLDLIENRLKDVETNLTQLQSETEDADLAEVITNLKMAENVQRSSLATGARVLQPSLVDFLR